MIYNNIIEIKMLINNNRYKGTLSKIATSKIIDLRLKLKNEENLP